jgi:hypothetical protein
LVELDQLDADRAVHHEGELVVGGRAPVGGSLGADDLEHVLLVLGDGHLLPRLGVGPDLEHVGERVVVGLVVDRLDAALFVVEQAAEPGRVLRHGFPLTPGSSVVVAAVRYTNYRALYEHRRNGPPRLSRSKDDLVTSRVDVHPVVRLANTA